MSVALASTADIVRSFMQDMERLDYASALKHVAADCEYTNPPPIGTVRGPDGIRAVLEPFFAPVAENQFKVLRQAVQGSFVFLERLDRHHMKDGRWIELPVTGVFEVRDGRITYWRDYFDAQTILSQWPTA